MIVQLSNNIAAFKGNIKYYTSLDIIKQQMIASPPTGGNPHHYYVQMFNQMMR